MGAFGQLAVAIVGGIVGGPIGFLIGSLIGSLLFPQHIQGPRLSNLKLQDSSYGQMVPIAYGTMRVPGIVIWQTDLKEHEHTSGGKGGPEVTTFSYSASFDCYMCEGPIDSVRKIWADGKLIFDVDGADNVSADLPCVVYIGDELQLPDATEEAEEGAGNVPAYRGIARCVFTDLDLTNYGNRIPNLNFEVATVGGQPSPIFKVHEYHDNPPHEWAYSGSPGGFSSDFGNQFPYITKWKLDGSDIRIYSNPSADVRTYANPTYVEGATDTVGPDEAHIVNPVSAGGGANFGWAPIGTYVYTDLSTTPLWYCGAFNGLVGSSTTNNAVGAGAAGVTGGGTGVTCSLNFAATAGVPTTEYVINTALSQDGKTLLVMTGPTTGFPRPTKWYRIINGTVTSSGTIAANLNIIGLAPTSLRYMSGLSGQASFRVSVLENNGEWLWCFTAGTDYQPKTTGPHYAGHVGIITLFKIDPATDILDWDATGAAAFATNPNETGIPYPAICSPAEGFAGVVLGSSLVLFSRVSGVGQITLAEIVSDLSVRSGLTTGEIDVTQLTDIVPGYVVNTQQATRDSILPLQSAYFFDGVESSGVMKFVKRGGASELTIPSDDVAARATGGQPPAKIGLKRLQEVDLPNYLDVKYVNAANDYQTGDQFSQRQTVESQLKKTIELSISLSDAKAKQVADVLLLSAWVERNQFTFYTSRKYDYLEPTDVVTVEGYQLRITQKKDAVDGTIQFDGVAALTSFWTSTQGVSSASSGFSRSPTPTSQGTNVMLLDVPLVTDSDAQIGFYVAAAGAVDSTWRGFALFESIDGGASYAQIGSSGVATVMGTVAEQMPDFSGGNIFDESTFLTLTVGVGGGTLSSATDDAVRAGANVALIGASGRWEMVQYRTAELTAPSTYKLSGFLRGRRGTEHLMPTHLAGDQFIALPVLRIEDPFSKLGVVRLFKAVTAGQTLAETTPVSFADRGASLAPYAPDELAGGLNGSGDLVVQWVRRTRIGGQWADYTDVPISEASELYVLQVWDSTFTVCGRVVTGLTSPTFTYTHAMQIADFGATQQHYYISVEQVGAYGSGARANAVIAGPGASDTAPLHPTQPYNVTPPPQPPASSCTNNVIAANPTWTVGSVQQLFTTDDFGPSDVWVIKFTVPASPSPVIVTATAAEYQGPPTPRTAYVSLSPCGAPLPGLDGGSGNLGFSFTMYAGAVPNPKGFQLQPSTSYYIICFTSGVSKMICNFLIRSKTI